jgi:hypothetical protein
MLFVKIHKHCYLNTPFSFAGRLKGKENVAPTCTTRNENYPLSVLDNISDINIIK